MNNGPLISIIIPSYKMGKYIGEALESVGKQKYENWEVIAVDDCGPEDGTKEIIEAYAACHPQHRIEFIRHQKNGGVSKARNTGIEASKGNLLAFLDPDDIWEPDYLWSHVGKLESDQNIAVSYTGASMIDENSIKIGRWFGPVEGQSQCLPESLYINCFILPSAVLARKEGVVSCGGFDEASEMQHIEDWDLWLRMMEKGMQFSYTPSAVCLWRRHAEASTGQMEDVRSREQVLRTKHKILLDRYSRKLMLKMLQRIHHLEGKQKAYEGNMFIRLGGVLSKVVRKLLRR